MRTPCRYCGAPLSISLVNLGDSPLANEFLAPTAEAIAAEVRYPLHVMVCGKCYLVQLEKGLPADAIFKHDYAYLSSYSQSWVAHAKRYAELMIDRFALKPGAQIIEVASNDGYLLQHFISRNMSVLGIEPAGHAAELARQKGVPSEVMFFNEATARDLKARGVRADIMTANNVLAHTPDIRDFAAGFPLILAPDGVVTFEFPHLLNLLSEVQFDTIYHEHYSYLSLGVATKVLESVGLRVFDVDELPTHGGSLRLYACHGGASHSDGPGLARVRANEVAAGLDRIESYEEFSGKVEALKLDFAAFLRSVRAEGKTIAGYGAAAKGNTFLNVCGLTGEDIRFVVDQNPEKQRRLLPGSHIPVHSPDALKAERPDYVVILPWNLADEIRKAHAYVSDWGGRFVTAVPEIRVY